MRRLPAAERRTAVVSRRAAELASACTLPGAGASLGLNEVLMMWTAWQQALDPVASLGSVGEGEADADDMGAGLAGLDHAEPLIRQLGGRHGAPRRRRMPGLR